MPRGPRGEKRPADVIGNAVKVMRIATGDETDYLIRRKQRRAREAARHAQHQCRRPAERRLPNKPPSGAGSVIKSNRSRQRSKLVLVPGQRLIDLQSLSFNGVGFAHAESCQWYSP